MNTTSPNKIPENFLEDLDPVVQDKGMNGWRIVAIVLQCLSICSYLFIAIRAIAMRQAPDRQTTILSILWLPLLTITLVLIIKRRAWGWILWVTSLLVYIIGSCKMIYTYTAAGNNALLQIIVQVFMAGGAAFYGLLLYIFLRKRALDYFQVTPVQRNYTLLIGMLLAVLYGYLISASV